MVHGGNRWATPWTNMHNDSCNMIPVIHGAAIVLRRVPSYSIVLTLFWLQTADTCLFKCLNVTSAGIFGCLDCMSNRMYC